MPARKPRRDNTSTLETHVKPTAAPLGPRDEQPAKTFILPADASPEARIVSLAHPSNGKPSRYLYCPLNGFFEFTEIGSQSAASQSCLLVPSTSHDASEGHDDLETENKASGLGSGYVMENASILVATPMDPRLLLMPLFKPGVLNERGGPHVARMKDDLLDDLAATSGGMKRLLRYPSARRILELALEDVCEGVDALGDTAYRPDSLRMLELIVEKAEAVVNSAWPASLESHVQKRFEVPAAIAVIAASTQASTHIDMQEPAQETKQMIIDEHSLRPSEEVVNSLRLKTAIDFILASYVPPKMKQYFESVLLSENSLLVDFGEMNVFLSRIEQLKAEAHALKSMSDNISRKRSAEEDDELQEARAEKVRKKEEDEKKRKQESRATKDLKKADTSGMKKLSSFFTKKTASSAG